MTDSLSLSDVVSLYCCQATVAPGRLGVKKLLNKREKQAVAYLDHAYKQRAKQNPEFDPDLVYFLGDNPWNRIVWSAASGRLPTLRMNRGLMWIPHRSRWLTARERLASMGFPVTQAMAEAMGSMEIPIKDVQRASSAAGNAMHFGVAGLVQMVALASYRRT